MLHCVMLNLHIIAVKLQAKTAIQNMQAWKTINSLLGRSCHDTVINELKVNNANITSLEEIADAFNEY